MASLTYFTGPMNCGKTTLALQVDYTESAGGRRGHRFTSQDRGGAAQMSSRIGISQSAVEVGPDFDFWEFVTADLTAGHRVNYLVCDEAQFYTAAHIDQLARIVDDLEIDVFCFGILTDFRTEMFPGSRRLVELSDRIEWLQARPRCWCGAPATHNARTVDGEMVVEGSQVAVGDTEGGTIAYETLCRKHMRRQQPAAIGRMELNPDPLPFDEGPEA